MSVTGRLTDTVALVTGASSGIGRATALALAEEGASVAVLARRRDRLRSVAERIEANGGRAIAVEADVADSAQAERAVDETVRELGRLDILVNNAGVGVLKPIEEGSVDEWRSMVEANVLGVMHCAHAALPHLLAATSGPRGVADMVNISSIAGRKARSGNGVYAATKHAVGAFSESLRQEVTERHLRVSVVEPGLVGTGMTEPEDGSPGPFSKDFEWLYPEDIADAVRYAATRPRRVAVNEILVRPTEQER